MENDDIVVFVTILFALSLITEKTTQFIRDYTVRANYFIIGLILLLQICIANELYPNDNVWTSLLLFFLLILNTWILLNDYFRWISLPPFPFSNIRWYTLVRVILMALIVVVFLLAPIFYGLMLLLELLFVLALLSLNIIKVAFPMYKTSIMGEPTFLTIPNVIQRQFSASHTKKNNSQINLLAFFVGFLFASSFNVNVFKLKDFLESKAEINPFFSGISKSLGTSIAAEEVYAFLSYVLVGFFLSFGSKFFHDLLDLVYSVKRTGQAVRDKNFYSLQNAEQVLSFLENYQVRHHLEEKRKELHQVKEVVGSGIVLEQINGRYIEHIEVAIKDENIDLTSYFKSENKTGDIIEIPYKIKKVGNFAQLLASPKIDWNVTIGNSSLDAQRGSFSVVVKKNNGLKYLLTCYHVLKHNKHDFKNFRITPNVHKNVNQGTKQIGEIHEGVIDYYIDAALIALNENIDLSDFDLERPIDAGSVPSKIENGLNIVLYGQQSKKLRYGQVKAVNQAYKIDYRGYKQPNRDGSYSHELNFLFAVNEFIPETGLSVEGDSGCCVYRRGDKLPIGIVVAKEDTINGDTLVVPLKNILDEFREIKFIYPLKTLEI
ncbi:hypothetical protein [Spongiimicrobium salis]|uniref:hypothetical protein n=1 Tax=Spongiimicrobium salis TaxID=1667022 RepID=UPI00374DB8A9